ncbi:unnamed protein product [Dimorphilus gyrociliatus]|uniref:Uncharacterized protein n=1 Tax=Dimorphilus gyrociliatus TaxID=2664684 RepID=A0A7I8VL85_9ANNE|nr:unnamed protein product [Dimorphilus gyrociliatus]
MSIVEPQSELSYMGEPTSPVESLSEMMTVLNGKGNENSDSDSSYVLNCSSGDSDSEKSYTIIRKRTDKDKMLELKQKLRENYKTYIKTLQKCKDKQQKLKNQLDETERELMRRCRELEQSKKECQHLSLKLSTIKKTIRPSKRKFSDIDSSDLSSDDVPRKKRKKIFSNGLRRKRNEIIRQGKMLERHLLNIFEEEFQKDENENEKNIDIITSNVIESAQIISNMVLTVLEGSSKHE